MWWRWHCKCCRFSPLRIIFIGAWLSDYYTIFHFGIFRLFYIFIIRFLFLHRMFITATTKVATETKTAATKITSSAAIIPQNIKSPLHHPLDNMKYVSTFWKKKQLCRDQGVNKFKKWVWKQRISNCNFRS